jgi:FkbM family methyltransferase
MASLVRTALKQTLHKIDQKDRVLRFRSRLRMFYSRYLGQDAWLRHVDSIVHVGANAGLEAPMYASFDLDVLWIEPIPHVYEQLLRSIKAFPKQRSYQALVTDRAAQVITLNISSNNGASSSIFDLAQHKEIWPDVRYTGKIELISETLGDILAKDGHRFDGLVMDTQGSELLILRGAEANLSQFKFIKTEAADFESYKGGTTVDQLVAFLTPRGFSVVRRDVFAKKPDGFGSYFDLLFKRC